MLEVLFQDEALIAIHKPSGLLVHRSMLDRHETRFALQMVRDQTGRHVYPVHRLDKGTSGILLFTFDRASAAVVAGAFERREVAKRYVAVVRGHPPETGVIEHALSRHNEESGRVAGTADGPAQDALTRYRRLASVELDVCVDRYPTSRYALLQLDPETGRQHQLRRHLKHVSHPIIGDATYGKGRHNRMFAERFGVARLLLACTALDLTHPANGHMLSLRCPPADDFMTVADSLGWTGVLSATPDS